MKEVKPFDSNDIVGAKAAKVKRVGHLAATKLYLVEELLYVSCWSAGSVRHFNMSTFEKPVVVWRRS